MPDRKKFNLIYGGKAKKQRFYLLRGLDIIDEIKAYDANEAYALALDKYSEYDTSSMSVKRAVSI